MFTKTVHYPFHSTIPLSILFILDIVLSLIFLSLLTNSFLFFQNKILFYFGVSVYMCIELAWCSCIANGEWEWLYLFGLLKIKMHIIVRLSNEFSLLFRFSPKWYHLIMSVIDEIISPEKHNSISFVFWLKGSSLYNEKPFQVSVQRSSLSNRVDAATITPFVCIYILLKDVFIQNNSQSLW